MVKHEPEGTVMATIGRQSLADRSADPSAKRAQKQELTRGDAGGRYWI